MRPASPALPGNGPDVLVLGAGASGLYFAAHAAARGRKVTVLDHGQAARKVRASGGGRCNLTHLATSAEDYLCANPHFVKSALARHPPADVLDFFALHGVEMEEKAPGQLLCRQGAATVVRALLDACAEAGVRLEEHVEVSGVHKAPEGGFRVSTSTGERAAPALVLALGGPSWPALGGSDFGFRLAGALGLKVLPPRPALVPLTLGGKTREQCAALAGVALRARLGLGGHAEEGDLLFTHRGLSGPAVLQLSSHWTRGREIVVDLLPGADLGEILLAARGETRQLKNLLSRHPGCRLPARLPEALLGRALAETPLNQLDAGDRERAARLLHEWRVTPSGTEGWAKAEVTAGGIDTSAFSSKTMEATALPGLFAIGEVLDVTGRLGGYNLQWAWSSAWAAAQHA
jgi:predicted Rossmann fold flavoprotein